MSGRKGKGGKSPVPHDGLFKTFLTHTDTARDFLALHLPDIQGSHVREKERGQNHPGTVP